MMILAPSILAADFKELGKEIQTIEENGAQYLHFDVMYWSLSVLLRSLCVMHTLW